MCFPYLFHHYHRVNHIVDVNDMVIKIKASTLFTPRPLSHIYIPSKTLRLGAPAHPPLYQFNEESKQR